MKAFLTSVVHTSQCGAHTILGHEGSCDLGDFLDVVTGSCGYAVEENFLSNTAAESHDHHVFELILRVQVQLIWQVLCETEGTLGTWNDSNLDERTRVFEEPTGNCVASFMEGNSPSLDITQRNFFLDTSNHTLGGLFELLDGDRLEAFPGSYDSCLVANISQVGSGEAWGEGGHFACILFAREFLVQLDLFQVDIEDLISLLDRRESDFDGAIKPAWS